MMRKDICHGSSQRIRQGSQTAIMPCWSLDHHHRCDIDEQLDDILAYNKE